MSDLIVFVLVVAGVAGLGIALGMILAGRLDRLMAPPAATEPPPAPQEEQS